MKETLRQTFLELSDHRYGRPFSHGLYSFTTTLLSTLIRMHPRVSAVYLRKKINEATHRPGLSDLDLTIVFDEISGPRMKDLARVRRLCRAVRRVAPMVGEVEFLTQAAFDDVQTYGPAMGSTIKYFAPVYRRREGPPVTKARGHDSYFVSVAQREVVWRYLRYLLPKTLDYLASPTRLRRARMEHAREQVNLRLETLGAPRSGSLTDLWATWDDGEASGERPRFLKREADLEVPPVAENFTRRLTTRLGWKDASVVLWNAFGVKGKFLLAVVVPDDRLEPSLRGFGETVHETKRQLTPVLADFPIQMPALITFSGFRAWMSTQPFEATEYALRGKSLLGGRPEISLPSFGTCANYIMNEYLSLLSLQNYWCGDPKVQIDIYRELIDQMDIYLGCFRRKEVTLDYAEQGKRVERGLADFHSLYGARLNELRGVLEAYANRD